MTTPPSTGTMSGSGYGDGSGSGSGYGYGYGYGSGYGAGEGEGDGDGYGDGDGSGYGDGSPLPSCGKHSASHAPVWGVLRVGCETHTYAHWIEHADDIDDRHGDGIAALTRALALSLQGDT